MVHLITTTEIGRERWTVRLYSVPYGEQQVADGYVAGTMETHAAYLATQRPQVFDDLILEGGLQGLRRAVDSEILQGSPTYENQKISFRADAVFRTLINTALRDLFTEIWVEIVVEYPGLICPAVQPGAMYWPRQRRLYFWGKLARRESTGAVRHQEAAASGSEWLRTAVRHDGTLEFTFVHWLKVRAAQECRPLLDTIAADHPEDYIATSMLLYYLVSAISPTSLFQIADWRNRPIDGLGDSLLSVGSGNLKMWRITIGDESELAKIWIPRKIAGLDGPLWDRDASPNEMSLYNQKDVGEFLVNLSEEFDFKFQVELPTLDAVGSPVQNSLLNRLRNWAAVTRWMFAPADYWPGGISIAPQIDTVHYTPSATWLSSVQCDLPQPPPAKVSGVAGGEIELQPKFGLVDYGVDKETDDTLSIKSLFRLCANYYDPGTGLVQDPRGVEFYVGDAIGALILAPYCDLDLFESGVFHLGNWGQLRAWLLMLRWGSARATVELEHRGVGLESFGESSGQADRCRRSYGTLDLGDFPLMRQFTLNPGLLYGDNEAGIFAVYDITTAPGGNTQIKAIEIKSAWAPAVTMGSDSPDPDAPSLVAPPTIHIDAPAAGSVVAGVTAVKATVTPTNTTIANVKLFVDAGVLDFAMTPGGAGQRSFSWDTSQFPNGSHALKISALDGSGNAVEASITVTVSN